MSSMRFLAILSALSIVPIVGAQTYSSVFDIVDSGFTFEKAVTDGVRNIYVAGRASDGKLTIRRVNENGSIAWTTSFISTNNAQADQIILDADSNVYVVGQSGAVDNRVFVAGSLNRADGTVRWSKTVAGVDDFGGGIAAGKSGNSVLLYAVASLKKSASNTDILAMRLNPATGAEIWRNEINLGGGVTHDFGQAVATNSTGAPFFMARRGTGGVLTSVIRLSGSDGSVVFRRDMPGLFGGPNSMRVLTGNNNVALSANNGDLVKPTTLALINGINGTVIAEESVVGFDDGGFATKFGTYVAPRSGSGTFLMATMNGITGRFSQITIPSPPRTLIGIDGASQVHYVADALGTGSKIERVPSGISGVVDFSVAGGTTDNLNNLILVGANHVAKLSQNMRINDDNINQSFGTVLSVPAPGVLENDFAAGATLAVVVQPTAGNVTLAQNGGFTYTPVGAAVTTDTFGYSATLNGETQVATVVVRRNVFESLTADPSDVIGSQPILAKANFKFVPTTAGEITVTDNTALIAGPAALSINTLSKTTEIPLTTAVTSSSFAFTVTARAYNTNRTLNVILRSGGLGNLTVGGTSAMQAGETTVGTVSLTAPAPSGGRVVTLTRLQGQATIANSVTVPAGATLAPFTILTQQSQTGSTLEVRATLFGANRTAFRIIQPTPKVVDMELASTFVGPDDVFVTVKLDKATRFNLPVTITLLNNTAQATAPASVPVLFGRSEVTFVVSTIQVGATKQVRIRAAAGGGQAEEIATIIANPLDRVELVPTSVQGGLASQGTVHLNNLAAQTGLTISLATNKPGLVNVPQTISIVPGSWSGTFPVLTKPVSITTTATVAAGLASLTRTATLTLRPN